MKFLLVFSLLFLVSFAYAQTPFRDTSGLTLNGIEWCEENYQLYTFIGNDFFKHHKHSIESRLCGNLYNDDLWLYLGSDRYQKLIEQSRMYYHLEIQESLEEAKKGIVDTKSVNIKEIPQEIAQQQKELTKSNETKLDVELESEPNEMDINTQVTEKVEMNDSEEGGCLIATATYGTEMAPQVQMLREIRDNQLMSTDSGVSFMSGFNQFYYSFSPYVADMERDNPIFKEIVKIAITPLLSSLSIMSYADSDSEVVSYGIGVILMNLGMYVVAPASVIYQIKNKRIKNNSQV
ncbi:CFI-box-CTERM domain-containing protein [Nitrosopumilus sp.]|uniref:CFI-box-CTERM domain-containing protein n=1 Tax=Nitrosopumilus sp. TaxID=2024843 RepID=UPI0034A01A9F